MDNYVYDVIGNLVEDKQEGTEIEWNVQGKVAKVTRKNISTGVAETVISYVYDATGNRIRKVKEVLASNKITTTFYARDAQGNTMAVYEQEELGATVYRNEIYLYGSDREGLQSEPVEAGALVASTDLYTRTLRQKTYELKDHLGNIRSTVFDEKERQINETFLAIIKTQNDYYPFGMQMPNRSYTNGEAYRYGFNGKEKDEEFATSGYDFGARMYDSRIGRWTARDPLEQKYPFLSTYSISNNNPIIYKDIDGRDWEITISYAKDGTKTIHIKLTAATINSSSNKKIDMLLFKQEAKNQIMDSYKVKPWKEQTGKMKNVTNGLDRGAKLIPIFDEREVKVKVTVNLRVITDVKGLKKNEHLIEIADDKNVTSKEDRKQGYTTLGYTSGFYGKYMRINESGVNDIINGTNKKTVPHEFGHTGGLDHPNEAKDNRQRMKDGTHDNNLMYQTSYQQNILKNMGNGNELRKQQIKVLYENYKKGKLNQNDIEKNRLK